MTKLIAFVVAAIVIVGCKSGTETTAANNATGSGTGAAPAASATPSPENNHNIVGKWKQAGTDLQTSVFSDDGTGATMTADPEGPEAFTSELDFNYKLEGDKLIRQIVSGKLIPQSSTNDETKKWIEGKNAEPLDPKFKQDAVEFIAWKDADTFTITTAKGKVTTYTRVNS